MRRETEDITGNYRLRRWYGFNFPAKKRDLRVDHGIDPEQHSLPDCAAAFEKGLRKAQRYRSTRNLAKRLSTPAPAGMVALSC